jgi:hypothetical protein
MYTDKDFEKMMDTWSYGAILITVRCVLSCVIILAAMIGLIWIRN